MNKTKLLKDRIPIIFIFGMIIIILIIIAILNSGKEQRISTHNTEMSTRAVYCKGSVVNNPFFNRYSSMDRQHEIKVVFHDDQIDKINYTYTGKYEKEELATKDVSLLHADYNIYMSKTSIDQEALLPTFSVINTDIIVNYSVDKETLTSETARLVFLDDKQYSKLPSYSINDAMSLYKNKGFHCEIIE